MLELSPTSINMFLRCQLQYQFRYIEGVKVPPSSAMVLGRSVHKALEENFRQKKESFEDLKVEDVLDIYSDAFEEYSKEVEKWEEDKGKEKDKGAKATKLYMKEKAKEINPDEVEEKIEIPVDEELKLVGYRDIRTVEGTIIDFKTTNAAKKEIPFDYKLQLNIYALKDDSLNAEIHFIVKKNNPQIISLKHSLNSETQVIDLAKAIKEQIKTGIFVPTGLSHQWACNYCGFKDIGLCNYKK